MKTETTVAIIDDDSIYRFTATRIIQLSHLAGSIHQFVSGNEALEYISTHKNSQELLPDIVLLDLNMPVTDGWMFLDSFREIKSILCKDIMIYLVTSSIDVRDIRHSKMYPEIKGFISKPLEFEKIKEILSTEHYSN